MKHTKSLFSYIGYLLAAVISIGLIVASLLDLDGLSLTETLAFITGGITVWLTVKENVWSWPIGIANSAFFFVLFLQARLFADMSLQILYMVLGFLGWYWWLFGGKHKTKLEVQHASPKTIVLLGVIGVAATIGMTYYLHLIHDSAPFLDALTTVLSLIAQYLLTKKYIQNWYFWITADVIYIGLYASKGLYLTSVLYFIFLIMCIIGLKEWRASHRIAHTPDHAPYV